MPSSWVTRISGEALGVELAEQVHDLPCRLGVEVAGGLVGPHDLGRPGQGPGDGDPLLLAAGQLGRTVVQTVTEPDPLQGRGGRRRPGLLGLTAGEQEGQLDVLDRR